MHAEGPRADTPPACPMPQLADRLNECEVSPLPRIEQLTDFEFVLIPATFEAPTAGVSITFLHKCRQV